jgi:hypothetical protein
MGKMDRCYNNEFKTSVPPRKGIKILGEKNTEGVWTIKITSASGKKEFFNQSDSDIKYLSYAVARHIFTMPWSENRPYKEKPVRAPKPDDNEAAF